MRERVYEIPLGIKQVNIVAQTTTGETEEILGYGTRRAGDCRRVASGPGPCVPLVNPTENPSRNFIRNFEENLTPCVTKV